MNETINKFSFSEDKFTSENLLHKLEKQNLCIVLVNQLPIKERIQKFNETGDSIYVFIKRTRHSLHSA